MTQDKSQRLRSLIEQRSLFLKMTRDFFYSQDFCEVNTPQLVGNPGLEIHLNYFKTDFVPDLGGGQKRTFYLPTSPEYHLKKALGFGLSRIFEITKSFRNGEITHEHEPEFLMLEWYRAPGHLLDIAQDATNLMAQLAKKFCSKNKELWQDPKHLTLSELFKTHCSVDLREMILDDKSDFDFEFSRMLVEHIEPALTEKGLVVLSGFPASQAALAQKNTQDPLFADRFEIYFQGLELANAFQELLDPIEQKARFDAELDLRKELGKDCPPIDFDLLEALKKIQKPAAGIALGLDRLLQALTGAPDLASILAFSHRDSL